MRKAIGWVGAVAATLVVLAPAVDARALHRPVPARHENASAWAAPAIGTVDVQRLQTEYKKANDLQDEYQAEQEKFQAELAEGQKKIEALQSEIASDDAAVAAATSDVKVKTNFTTARDAAKSKLKQVQAEYANRLRRRKEKADALADQLNSTLLGQAKRAVATVAQQHHLEAVIDSRVGLLGLPDITDDVLKLLNSAPAPGRASSKPAVKK